MIFKRKKSDDIPSTSREDIVDQKTTPKFETLYVAVVCFVVACLSYIVLEIGARSPLGHSVTKSATFNAIFRRSYNMKIKIMITNVMMGLLTTIMLALGDMYEIPYLYVPWLVNTMKGMLFYEGPALLSLSYVWLPDTGIASGAFVFITFLLYVEELCLWFDVLSSFKHCWVEYTERRMQSAVGTDNNNNNATRLTRIMHKHGDQKPVEHAVAKSRLWDEAVSAKEPPVATLLIKSTASDSVVRLRSTRSSSDAKPGIIPSKTLEIAI